MLFTPNNNLQKPQDSDAFDQAPFNSNTDILDKILPPLASIMPFAGQTDPSGANWLICNGRTLSRVGTYASIFAVIGTSYGVGNGSTTFNIPDFRDRVPVGVSGTIGRGAVGGAKTQALSWNDMPSHNHGISDPGHGHGLMIHVNGGGNIGVPYVATGVSSINAQGGLGSVQGAGTGIGIQNAGGNGTHNNMQPYVGTNYIIRVL
jgi:microcystin-dependent protein